MRTLRRSFHPFFAFFATVPFLLGLSAPISLEGATRTPEVAALTARLQHELTAFIQNKKDCPEDLVLLLNVLYFSYERSTATLKVQDSFHKHQSVLVKLGHCICATRRNPSKPFPHVISSDTFSSSAQRLGEAFEQYKKSAAVYVHCTDYALTDPQFSCPEFTALVKHMRAEVKKRVLTTASTYYEIVQTALNGLSNLVSQKGIIDSILNNAPAFASKTFVAIDREYIDLSDKTWNFILSNSQSYGHVWELIERDRAKIYHALYTTCFEAVEQLNSDALTHACLFGPAGLLDPRKRSALPHPSTLTYPFTSL